MILESSLVKFNSIKVNGKEIDQVGRVSYNYPFNEIKFEMAVKNTSLNYFEVRVTNWEDEYDIEVGELVYYSPGFPASSTQTFTIKIDPDKYPIFRITGPESKIKTFRVGLYARSAVDNSWDVAYFVFTTNNEQLFITELDSNGNTKTIPLCVLTKRDIPTIKN